MGGARVTLLLLGLLVFAIPFSSGVAEPCIKAYNEGGVSAVLQSPECSHQIMSNQYVQNQTTNCEFTSMQGQREVHRQRISCNLDMQIPILGKYGTEQVKVGVVAIFDSTFGTEASEMASELLLDYFFVNSVFISDKWKLPAQEEYVKVNEQPNKTTEHRESHLDLMSSNGSSPRNSNKSRRLSIFKEALIKTIHDIDSKFTKEALERNLLGGSVVTVAVLVDDHILVGNLGSTMAILCSENAQSDEQAKGNIVPHISAKELTNCSSSRPDEKERLVTVNSFNEWMAGARIPAGYKFTPIRAIGLVYSKSAGLVVSEPRVSDWHPIQANDNYLVLPTLDIFYGLTKQDVCELLHYAPPRCASRTLSDCITSVAYEEGSIDNLSVIVVPLRPSTGIAYQPSEEKNVMSS